MTTEAQALAAANKAPDKRSTHEQAQVDECRNIQAVRNADFKARGNKNPGE